ncbi:hypothetical protein BFC20_10950 [Brochothrix thermosphacta]|uniref:hypothetical protein n=1 Tax=Brochothrix thermosphacta TaxID=2756 RepID=UPI000E722B7F|nr:hypothetical protein [Brochothrix thermosphacta]ANZ98182.1 hypothetical protein BFC20_10950 [Brochothrix thermosphacta]
MKKITEVDYTNLHDLSVLTNEAVEALGVLDDLFNTNYNSQEGFTTSQALQVLAEVKHLAPVYMVVMRALKQQTDETEAIIEKYELQNEQ